MSRFVPIAAALLLTSGASVAAEPVERRLHPSQIEASSFLWNSWNKFQENYHGNYIADDDPKTAWVEGVEGNGEGSHIRLAVTPLDGTTRVRLSLRNGYQKSKKLFAANARARKITVTLQPSKTARTVELRDAMDWQDVVIDQVPGKLDAVEVRIDSVFKGTRYEDLCISDARVFATSTTPDNPAFEKSKLDKLLAWKAERVEAARLFTSDAAKSIPIAAQYKVAQRHPSPDDDEECPEDGREFVANMKGFLSRLRSKADARHQESMALAKAALQAPTVGWKAVQVVPTDKRRTPRVDGMDRAWFDSEYVLGCFGSDALRLPVIDALGFFDAEGLGIFEVDDKTTFARAIAAEAKACNNVRKEHLFAWAKMAQDDKGKQTVRALMLVRCGMAESRGGYEPVAIPQLLVYDGGGHLELAIESHGATAYEWSNAGGLDSIAGGVTASSAGVVELRAERAVAAK